MALRPSRPMSSFALTGAARLYLLALGAASIAAAMPFYLRVPHVHNGWISFVVLAVATTVTQMFPVKSPRNVIYQTSIVFLFAASLVLRPELLVLIPLVQTVPEWLKERYPWPMEGSNVANYTLSALAAWGTADVIRNHGASVIAGSHARFALAGLAACVAFIAVNHTVVALTLRFVRGHGFAETRLFSLDSVSIDLVLAMLGLSLAAFWHWDPWLAFAAVAPLIVVHRTLSIPQLQAEARIDPKTGLYNARHFASALESELSRARRFDRPMAVIMADLDLLREINNNYGHLAGDVVLQGVAEVFRAQLRHYDVPARFGGEEFSILLPETDAAQAFEIAECIRRAVAESDFDVDTAAEPVRATVSIGVAAYPEDGSDANQLVHQADLAVYRAKLHGRNRALRASSDSTLADSKRTPTLRLVSEDGELPEFPSAVDLDVPRGPEPQRIRGPHFVSLPRRLATVVVGVSVVGIGAGIAGLVLGHSANVLGLIATMVLVGGGQALAIDLEDVQGTVSVSAVGSLAGAYLFDYRAALPLALIAVLVEWSARRPSLHHVLYNIGALSLATLAAAGVFDVVHSTGTNERLVVTGAGLAAGLVYFAVSMSLISLASAVEGRERPSSVFREQYAWLLPHYVVYGFIGAVMGIAYHAVGIYALAVFAVPLVLMRNAQNAYLAHTRRSARRLREAAETIQTQNVSLERANRLLRERSTAAMESLSATVDARDSYTAGHSRRVREIALAVGRVLELSREELELLGYAALFHDIGKLAIPDAILLKPGPLLADEWALMQTHAEEGARIIERLGFLHDAVPSIRHHHERFDGTGYPHGIAGEEIPLGARIIHVADALDSMLTTRIYRAALRSDEALRELKAGSGTQFCPRCVQALERILPLDERVPTPERLRPALVQSA
jgi:diguanylate cyclase (GGDEF)-like protein/putative nucleotidyltransferase with HDIG domain